MTDGRATPMLIDGKPVVMRTDEHPICLRPISLRAAAEPEPRIVLVSREDDLAWYGRPALNPDCPVLEWPKAAWEEVQMRPCS